MVGWIQCSFSTNPAENDGDGFGEDLPIKPERPVVDVFEVKLNPVFEAVDLTATADLP